MTTDVSLNAVNLSTAVPDAIILRPLRPLLGARRDVHAEVPGKAGSWTFTEEPGDRIIELEVSVESDTFTARRDALEDLADWADVGAIAQLIADDQSDRFWNVILAEAPDVDDWLNHGSVTLRFRAHAYAMAVSTSSEAITANSNPDSGSFAAADALAAEPIIEITPLDGTLTGFTLTLNGDALTYASQTIGSGVTLTISTISDTVTLGVNGDTMLTGAYTGTVIMSDVSGAFPLIIAGTNAWAITWTGTATNIAIAITWRRRYRR